VRGARLVDAAASFRYAGRLHIQVLDDSNDETPGIVAERVAAHRLAGVSIDHLRRSDRSGFKAGALAHGLELTSTELVAVFDADFVPPPELLEKMVPWFADADVGWSRRAGDI